jgi:predicted nucleic acid-binding protein
VTGTAYLVDTAVLAYAVGGSHPRRADCQAVVTAASSGRIELHASVEMVQEFVFHRMRRGDRASAVRQGRDVAQLCVLHDFDTAVLHTALGLIADTDGLGGRDAVHAATALRHGLSMIISPDVAFDNLPGIRRIDPAAAW